MEKQKLDEEACRKRRKEVDTATAKAKKEKEERDRRKELKARVAAEEYNLFLVKESERELMLAEEAKKQLARKSEEADRVREAMAEKDWQELQEKESAEGVPVGAPVFRYRSIQADRSREMLESMGNLRDRWSKALMERCNWFDSDLCILEPIKSMQLAAFKQLKLTGLLCSRFSATVRKGRRFFTLAGEDAELPNGRGGKRKEASRQQQRPASPAVPALDGGSRVEGGVAEDPLAVPGPSGLNMSTAGVPPSVLAVEPAAAVEPASQPLSALAAESETAAERAGELTAVAPAAAATDSAVKPAVQPAAAVEPANQQLSVLAAESAAGLAGESAAAVPAAAMELVAKSAVLADGPAAAPGGCWVMNSAISPKVIVKRTREGLAVVAAAEAATLHERQAGEPLSVLGCAPAAGRAAAESVNSPPVAVPRPAASVAAAQGKRKANAGAAEGSQKRKRSSPVKLKDLQ